MYALYVDPPDIEYDKHGRRYHAFRCIKKTCRHVTHRYLDKKDAKSTKSLLRHSRACWGEDVVKTITDIKTLGDARKAATGLLQNGTITSMFERKSKTAITYSSKQMTRLETRYGEREVLCKPR